MGGLNLYGYAGGDPVNFGDPFGLSPDTTSATTTGEASEGDATEDPTQVACPTPSFRGTEAGQAALEWYRSIYDDLGASPAARGAAAVGGFFAALWTPETAERTMSVLTLGYGARVHGPLPQAGVPRPVQRGRETFRVDPPHHGKRWHVDGTVTGTGAQGTKAHVDLVACASR
jgi:hypothetical protein